MTSPLPEDDDDLGPITPEFLAHINAGFGRPMPVRNEVPVARPSGVYQRRAVKRPREEVSSRSRSEIINWVLSNDELIRVCICPYCLKIHSRRDNARVHIKNQHVGLEVRDFVVDRDASILEVRSANQHGKFPRIPEKRPPAPLAQEEQPELKVLNMGDPLETFLKDIDKQIRQQALQTLNGEASTSVDVPISSKQSREPSPNSSLQGTPTNASTPSSQVLPFGCVFCPCSFLLTSELSTHTNRTHRTRYRCNCCFAEFVHSKQLEDHYNKDHVSTLG